jgi:TRAP-type mannitol/chloroaromatic compound transport system substrate-binding protein
MDRREFLKTTGGVAAAATAGTVATAHELAASEAPAAPAIGSGTQELGLAMPWPDNGKGFGDSARRLARRIEALTGGRYRVAMREGADAHAADLAHGSAHHHLSHHAAFAYFAGLPGDTGLAAGDLAAWLEVGGGQTLWDDLAAGLGFKPLLAGHGGASPPLWSSRPMTSLADLEGGKISAPGLGPDVARALGAEPVALEPRDVVEALSRGTIGFAEWGGALHSMALGLHTSAVHATGSGLNGNGTALSLAVRLPLWESLSAGDKSAIAAAAAEEFRVSLWEAQAHEAMIRSALTQAHGVRFLPFPADVADALSRVAAATVAHIAGRDERSARIDHSYMAFRSAVTGAAHRTALVS